MKFKAIYTDYTLPKDSENRTKKCTIVNIIPAQSGRAIVIAISDAGKIIVSSDMNFQVIDKEILGE